MDKPKIEYLSEWFNAVPARWYGMTAILLVIVTGIVAGIIWLARNDLEWWWIVLGALVVIIFIILSFIAYCKVAMERDRVTQERDALSCELASTKDQLDKLQRTPPTQIAISHQFIPDNYIRGRIIYIMDLLTVSK